MPTHNSCVHEFWVKNSVLKTNVLFILFCKMNLQDYHCNQPFFIPFTNLEKNKDTKKKYQDNRTEDCFNVTDGKIKQLKLVLRGFRPDSSRFHRPTKTHLVLSGCSEKRVSSFWRRHNTTQALKNKHMHRLF